jgi:hypothetical protein
VAAVSSRIISAPIVKNILTEFKGDWYELPEVHGA